MADKKALWISDDGRRNAKQERLAALMADLNERGVIGAGMSDIGIRHDCRISGYVTTIGVRVSSARVLAGAPVSPWFR